MTLRDLALRLRALFRRRQVEAELDDELAFHLACEERKQIDAGMDPAEARIQARARFGSVALAADGIGLVTGGAMATALAAVLLSLPAAGQIGAVVHVSDPLPYVAGLSCIALACLLAALVPARRASRIDPIETLRQE